MVVKRSKNTEKKRMLSSDADYRTFGDGRAPVGPQGNQQCEKNNFKENIYKYKIRHCSL